ncbi:MAG: hybrid sensor histidine kinase/response regulator [Verrucomicrobia bacterium]|nr:hybrid sensor histidine kinase/response regulator [Verrucomicrobiota bacterium]
MNFDPNASVTRILIVDDQPANLRVLGSMLGQLGYEIVAASDGPTALKRLVLRPPDLVLLDLLMPGMDGFEVCRRIREMHEFTDLPVIFLSAADEKSLIVRALDCGGVDFVTKPFNQAELMRRVQTHLALKQARDRLQQLARDKDELIGILAHDLKNALGSVLMNSQLLQRRTEGDTRLNQLSTQIVDSTDRTLAFVRQFLANSAADHSLRIERQRVAVRSLVEDVLDQHQAAAARKQQQLELKTASDLPNPLVVFTDAGALRQVLENLISNAVKFSPPQRPIEVTLAAEPEGVRIEVRDQGPGFTVEDLAQMFRRYQRLSARPTAGEPSTGLGLSIAQKLMGLLGGHLDCISTPGAGATFRVRLPFADSPQSPSGGMEARPRAEE